MPDDLNSRVNSLEEQQRHVWAVLDNIALKQERLDEVVAELARAQRETEQRFRETEQRFRETEQRFRETDERFRKEHAEAQQRGREVDARIDKLVSAIGEYIRRRDSGE